jgi:hypothetical protein
LVTVARCELLLALEAVFVELVLERVEPVEEPSLAETNFVLEPQPTITAPAPQVASVARSSWMRMRGKDRKVAALVHRANIKG